MKIFKDTKWWMYLPFACVAGTRMVNWVLKPKEMIDREWRMSFLIINLFETCLFMAFIFVLILKNMT